MLQNLELRRLGTTSFVVGKSEEQCSAGSLPSSLWLAGSFLGVAVFLFSPSQPFPARLLLLQPRSTSS